MPSSAAGGNLKDMTGRVLLATIVLASACGHASSAKRAAACKSVEPGRYFPVGTIDAFGQRWYGGQLCAMGEEPLARRGADEAYRFLWLRSFHHPVSVRVESSPAGATLDAVELDGRGGYDPGEIKQRQLRKLAAREWAALQAAIEAAGFWDMPTTEPDEMGYDGAEWVLEGKRGGRTHVVHRWTPQDGSYRAACDAFLTAAQLSFPADEVY